MSAWIVVTALLSAGPQLPEPLLHFQEARNKLRSGHVEASVLNGPRIVGMPFHRYGMEVAKNGDMLLSYRGDEEGVLSRDAYGYPVIVGGAKTLVQPDNVWMKYESSAAGELAPRGTYNFGEEHYWCANVDLRTIGMVPDWGSQEGQTVSGVLSKYLEAATQFTEERDGSVHKVTACFPNNAEVTYEIDEARGWNARRISGVDGRGPWTCDIDLEQRGGAWFPARVSLERDGEVVSEWVVSQAAFNSPKDAPEFTPEAVGLETAMQVYVRGRTGGETQTWDGTKLVPHSEIMRRLAAGELQRGRTLIDLSGGFDAWETVRVRCRASAQVVQSWISGWEHYVERFCSIYQLNREQEARAYRCLRTAQARANAYLRKSKEKFEQLRDGFPSGKLSSKEAKERMTELRKPVEDIFDQDLKPCLEKIPTRAQFDQAEERKKQGLPSSQVDLPIPWHRQIP